MESTDNEKITPVIERIKAIKQRFNDSSECMAAKLGVSRGVLDSYTSGRRSPNYSLLVQLLSAYPEVSAEWLMRGTGEMMLSDNNTEELKKVIIERDAYRNLVETAMRDSIQTINEGKKSV